MLVTETTNDRAGNLIQLGIWSCCSHRPGRITSPNQLDDVASEWLPAAVPGTVAQALADAGQWDMQRPPSIDDLDWWYRTAFTFPSDVVQCCLCFDGLATLAEVWLNGELRLQTDNMFRSYRLDISTFLQPDNELVIGFRSLTANLQTKRPRPRWKTNLVNQQQLRWLRTNMLGRIPGWSPPVPTIGPWRSVRIESTEVIVSDQHIVTQVEGDVGVVSFEAKLYSTAPIGTLRLHVGTTETELTQLDDADCVRLQGTVRLPNVQLWWPHTHGQQFLYDCSVLIDSNHEIDCGRIGFRTLKANRQDGFSVEINGQPVYCRGACWTVADVMSPDATEATLRHDLMLARDAGANMLRLIGTMSYERDLFYRLCDEFGILVWQDFPFANMDYPVTDPSFAKNIETEAIEQLRRLSSHPCVGVYCGNSEVEQQAAMLGMPRESWSNQWFSERLPQLCCEHHPGTEYVPSTPTGGLLPFHPNTGISHFYGIGAYLRSPAELRQTDVKFTPECLGFSNIPEPENVHSITEGALPVCHHPNWKRRVPRDTGAGWDFEDVRDHYLKQIYGVEPVALRSYDTPRYMELSRTVPGEMMSLAFSEWRSRHSHNHGGLVWFFKDLWPAAGWGIVDSDGIPKSTYFHLKRVWSNRQVLITDEGLNGLHLHAINESSESLSGSIEVVLLKEPNVVVARKEVAVELPSNRNQLYSADEILGGFYDVNHAYKFGPAHHDVVAVTLFDSQHQVVSESFYFVRRRDLGRSTAVIEATAALTDDSKYEVTLTTDRFLHATRLSAKGYLPDDNYFHLMPGRQKTIRFTAITDSPARFRAEVEALNLDSEMTVTPSADRE